MPVIKLQKSIKKLQVYLKTTLPSSYAHESLCTAEYHLYTFHRPSDKYLHLQMSQGIIFSQKLAWSVSFSVCARTSYLLQADILREVGMTPFFPGYFCSWQNPQDFRGSFPTIKARKNWGGEKLKFRLLPLTQRNEAITTRILIALEVLLWLISVSLPVFNLFNRTKLSIFVWQQ